MAGPLRRFGFLLAIVALGLAIGTTVSPVTAQPVPEELDRVCVNRYSGQLRYVRSGQSCTSSEFELRTIADLPYTLCANIYTSTLRYAPTDNCNPATERAYPLPDALPLALCVNRYTAAIVVSPYSGQCPPGSFAAAVSQVEPVANDDGTYIVLRGEDLTITTADENDLLDNDVLGVPAGAISSFGLSDAGEVSVPGSTTLAGGELTVDADGSFSLTGADTTGDYSFFYRLSNPAGTSEAEVTIQVQELPDAVDDSNRVEAGGNISAGAGGGLLENDEVGYPEARIVSFGGGALDGILVGAAAGICGRQLAAQRCRRIRFLSAIWLHRRVCLPVPARQRGRQRRRHRHVPCRDGSDRGKRPVRHASQRDPQPRRQRY